MIKQKAAMFGLDARIALAIFGALSIIIGSSLLSAIQNARATAHLHDFNEVIKAIEEYQLDTGSYIELFNIYNLRLEALLVNYYSLPNWKGPYLDTSIYSLGAYGGLDYETKSGSILIRVYARNSGGHYCQAGKQDCHLSINIYCQNTGGGPGKDTCDAESIPLLENYGYTYSIASGGYKLTKRRIMPYYQYY